MRHAMPKRVRRVAIGTTLGPTVKHMLRRGIIPESQTPGAHPCLALTRPKLRGAQWICNLVAGERRNLSVLKHVGGGMVVRAT